jgi:hypothetical protein
MDTLPERMTWGGEGADAEITDPAKTEAEVQAYGATVGRLVELIASQRGRDTSEGLLAQFASPVEAFCYFAVQMFGVLPEVVRMRLERGDQEDVICVVVSGDKISRPMMSKLLDVEQQLLDRFPPVPIDFRYVAVSGEGGGLRRRFLMYEDSNK